MALHQQSIVIKRPLADVFAYMGEIDREHEWQPHLREAEQTPAGPTTVGTRRRYVSEFLGKRLENTYVVKQYEPRVRIVLETTKDSVVEAKTDIRWESVGTDTRVTMALEGKASGPLRFVPSVLIEATFEKEVSDSLARLKEILERDA